MHYGVEVIARGVVHAYHCGACEADKTRGCFAVEVVERRRSASAVKVQDIAVKIIGIKRFRKYGGLRQSKAFETHIFRRSVFLRFCGYLCRKRGAGKARREGYKPDKSAC